MEMGSQPIAQDGYQGQNLCFTVCSITDGAKWAEFLQKKIGKKCCLPPSVMPHSLAFC